MSVQKVIARAWTDAAYKAKLLKDPRRALADAGIDVPEGTNVRVVENTADTVHVVLPLAPGDAGQVAAEELERVAGGAVDAVSWPGDPC